MLKNMGNKLLFRAFDKGLNQNIINLQNHPYQPSSWNKFGLDFLKSFGAN